MARKMKTLTQSGIVLLAMLLLAGSTGFTITRFYCGPHLQSIHIFREPVPCCSQSNESGGFCHSEKEYVKADIQSELPVKRRLLNLPKTFLIFVRHRPFTLKRENAPLTYIENPSHSPPLLCRYLAVFTGSFLF